MANILSVDNLTHNWGDIRLFSNIFLGLEEGQKAALIARNGAGKTTLLNIIAKKLIPDNGEVTIRNGIKTAYLTQDPQIEGYKTVVEALFSSDNPVLKLISEYEQAIVKDNQQKIALLIEKMEHAHAWDYESRIKQILSELKITNITQKISQLSGGQIKRVALATALINEPDFLILDEPTNHLDLDMINWLENYLSRSRSTLMMVTHDRFFLDIVCNSIFEIDNEKLYLYQGNYSYFLEKREERIFQKNQEIEKVRNLLRKEQDWMNRMPQARATKAKYRINAFYELKDIAHQRIEEQDLELNNDTQRLGNKVINIEKISKSFNGNEYIKNFTYKFAKGEKIGIVGKNGIGKSALLNIITGDLKQNSGTIDIGETVVIGYYRQEGMKLDDSKRVIDVISEIADVIHTKNSTITAAQLLRYFLFPNEMHYVQVRCLSGGEKKRLYLMTVLMKKPNFLILDEPTNDIDIQTLTVLEEYLASFQGCLLIVSHDRYFLDNVINNLFVFEGNGIIKNFPGNYSQYIENKNNISSTKKVVAKSKISLPKEKLNDVKPQKLTFKEKQELAEIELKIENLENEKKTIENKINSGSLLPEQLKIESIRLDIIIKELNLLEERWMELELKIENFNALIG